MPKNIVVDSGFWFALFNERDRYHAEASILEEDLLVHRLIVPWPTLYEAVNTRFVRRSHDLARLKAIVTKTSSLIVDDGPYRVASLEYILSERAANTSYSLVDHVLRSMLSDENMRIDAVITFNPKDFYDVCDSRNIVMLYR